MRRAAVRLLVLAVLATATTGRAAPEVIVRSGALSPNGLPYSRFAGVGIGEAGDLAVLATTTGVFRAVRVGGAPAAERVFGPGDQLDGKTVIGADAPALAPDDCVVARLGFSDGSAAIYRRCGAANERVAGVGDAVDALTIRQVDGTVVTAGGYVAFIARLSDGHAAVVRGGSGPLVAIVTTGQAGPVEGTISSLRLIGIRTNGVVGFGATVVEGRDGLFEGDGGAPRKVLVEGDETGVEPLPGIVDAIDGASMNRAGVFAFLGTLDGGTRGIFVVDARPAEPVVDMIVRAGDPAPGVKDPPEIKDPTFGRFVASMVPVIDAGGSVAFRVNLGGDATGAGIFVHDPDGTVRKIVTTRDQVNVVTGEIEKERRACDTPRGGELRCIALTRLRDPALADDGSLVVVAAPPSEGVGLFVARGTTIAELIKFGAPADVGASDQLFRFVLPSVASTAEGAVFLGQHDVLLAVDGSGGTRVVTQLGAETPLKGVFSEIDLPGMMDDGHVAFRGEVLDGKTGQGVFLDRGPDKLPKALAKAGKGAPGPGRYRDFPPTVGDSEASVEVSGTRIAFLASIFDSSAFEGTFLVRKGGGGASLARVNMKAPGGGEYVSVDLPAVLDRKHYAFSALVRDDSTRQAVFWHDGGKTRIVARQGLETLVRIGGRFQAFSPPDLGAGGFVFKADVGNARNGIFLALGTRRGLLLATGDPSEDQATLFRTLERPVWAGSTVAFTGSLQGIPSLRGLFTLTTDGSLPPPDAPPRPVTTLLREGTPAPEGGTILDVRPPAANAQGRVASVMRVEGGPAEQLVVRVDTATPPSP
jgi:hypothetical protein